MNPMQMIQMIRGSGNPQQMMMNMIKQNSSSNPMLSNAMKMMENGNTSGVEDMVKNICKDKGIDPNDVMKATKNMFGMK
jgi:hypothetical protein